MSYLCKAFLLIIIAVPIGYTIGFFLSKLVPTKCGECGGETIYRDAKSVWCKGIFHNTWVARRQTRRGKG